MKMRNLWIVNLALLAVIVSPPGCLGVCIDETQYTTDCSTPFRTLYLGLAFWENICSTSGRVVFSCLNEHYADNCTVYDREVQEVFTSEFQDFKFSIDFACEYRLNSVCREIAQCFNTLSSFKSTSVYEFYEYFCGLEYLQFVFDCMDSKRGACPVTAELWSNSLNFITYSGVVTYAVIQQKSEIECAKLTVQDATCLSLNTTSKAAQCDSPPVLDTPNSVFECGEAGQTITCISDTCGSAAAEFFTQMLELFQCDTRVSGGWTDWGSWSDCSATCGSGIYVRSRSCTNPPPSRGGLDCVGATFEADGCIVLQCPVDGGFGVWGLWSSCSTSCNNGTQTRSRLCNNPTPAYDGKNCEGERNQSQECNNKPCPVNGDFSAWSPWSDCSVTCGFGSQTKTRSCNNPVPANGGADCLGSRSETTQCEMIPCPVNGMYSPWSSWSGCTVSCGGGSMSRKRTCTNPPPAYGGSPCSGPDVETQSCSTQECIKTTCVEVTDNYGVWPKSSSGQIVSIPCGKKYYIGNYTRRCINNGVWDVVSDHCELNVTVLQDLSKQVQDILNSTQNITEKLDSVATRLTDLTADTESTGYGTHLDDILVIVNDVTDVVKKSSNITDNAVQKIFEAVSNIIGPEATKAWNHTSTTALGSEVLGTVDNLVAALIDVRCDTLSDVKIIDKTNIYSEIGKLSDGINFPTEKDVGTSINVPYSTLSNKGVTETCFGGSYYSSVAKIIEDTSADADFVEVGSDIIAVQLSYSLDVKFTNLVPPVRITLPLKNTTDGQVTCVFWDFSKTNISKNGAWSSKGCVLVNITNNTALCECSHLTNFAILMSPYKISAADSKALGIISAIGCAISMFCLVITIVVHCAVWRLVRSDRVVILMNLCVALLLALAMFLVGVNRTESREVCVTIAAVIQVLFLAAFAFMLLIGLEILITVVHVFVTKFRIKILIPLAWVIPVIIVGVSLAVTKAQGYGNKQFCWLDTGSGLIWSFIGPVLFVIFVNFVVIVVVFKKMASSSVLKSKPMRSQIKTTARSLCVLLPVLGLTWGFGVFAVNTSMVAVQYLFCIFNSLQGLLIFLFHCVFNIQIRSALKRRRDRKRSLETFSSSLRKRSRTKSLATDEQVPRDSTKKEYTNMNLNRLNNDAVWKKNKARKVDNWEREQRRKYHRNLRLASSQSSDWNSK